MEGKQQTEVKEVFNLLESKEIHVIEDIKKLIQENLSSNREAWLVQSLVDYYYTTHSRSVVSICTELREPHDKHLLEKLHDGIKSPEHQLLALQLLLHVVCRQPVWIHKVVTTSVFKVILKCLKVDTNIPVLMTGVTTIAILLPSVPTLIGPYIPELFEIYNRLASFSLRKPAGNNPDVFLLHLEVSVYALFHRLYGMFPYHFLTYMRHYYTKKENMRVFEEVVQPMLERVRLHPNLIIGTKDQETKDRWRQMETQDVVAECAKMSLDLVEGTWEELHCPIVSSRYYRKRQTACKRRSQFSPQITDTGFSVLPKPDIQSLSLDNVFWSPSEIVGLSTPPASQRNTPGPSVLETSTSSNAPHPSGAPILTPLMTPPVNTPTETPPITDEVDKTRAHSNTKLQDPKRLSSEFSHSYTAVPLMTPSSHSQSIPPSPLKPEFTNTPPFGIIRTQPVLNAARELQFDNPPSDQSDVIPQEIKSCNQSGVCGKNIIKPVQLELGSKERITPGQGTQFSPESEAKHSASSDVAELTDSLSKNEMEGRPRDNSEVSQTETVSINNISQVIESLENEDDIDDDEVSELTSSTRSHTAYAMLTAESVAKFMKSVNRIRFNSLTSRKSVEKLTKLGSKTKSLSCPLLPKIDTTMEEEEELSRSASTTFENKSSLEMNFGQKTVETDIGIKKSSEEDPNLSVTSTGSAVTITTKQETSVTIATSEPTSSLNITKCPMYADSVSASKEEKEDDFVKVFRLLLNPTSVSVCQRCQSYIPSGENTHLGSDGPLFSGYSPPELLDRHLQLGSDIHTKELSKIPIPSTQNINWTHFGGVPPADEINIVRGQLLLLHNQLLYERHKREQHTKRNRRLLRKIAHANTLEEQNRVMAEQIYLKEMEVRDLQVSLKKLLEENRKLKNAKESDEYEKLVHLRTCLQENEDLKAAKKEFNTLFVRQREDQDNLKKKLMNSEAKLFNTEKELECMRQQAVINSKLKEQVIQLHKELLLMGELQQKSQEKLQSQRIANSAKHEHEYIQASLRAEIKALKGKLESKTVRLEECRRQCKEQQEQLNIKEIALAESKRNIERIKISHDDEIKSVEAKHKTSLYINQALETHILEVYREIEELKTKVTKQGLYRHASRTPEMSASRETDRNHSNVLHPVSRERTNSDPLRQRLKQPLARMGSEPLGSAQTSGHSQDHTSLSKSFDLRSHEGSRSGGERSRSNEGLIDKVPHEPGFSDKVDIVESGDFVVASIVSRDSDIDRHDTESMSSRSSVLNPSGASLLYTDSEDNRSISNRSSNLGDSGYMG